MPCMFRCFFERQRPSRGSSGYSAGGICEPSIVEAVTSLYEVNTPISYFQL